MKRRVTRRRALGALGVSAWALAAGRPHTGWSAPRGDDLRLATFRADVTPPLGDPILFSRGNGKANAIVDPLSACGLVLLGADRPLVLVSIDWCEIRNDAYRAWREALAEAAGTEPGRVLISSVHQHDAPVADLTAQKILKQYRIAGDLLNPQTHARQVQQTAAALKESLQTARRVTHLALGEAEVRQVASNRRVTTPEGKVYFGRNSATRDPALRAQEEGEIDPKLKTIGFYDGQTPLAAVSCYATHPMSYYGAGEISCDFPGLARRRRQEDDPSVLQIYCSGCSGDVTAGKYNDGSRENRAVLAERLYDGMVAAWQAARRVPLEQVAFRSVPVVLPHRDTGGYTVEELEKRLSKPAPQFITHALAALGLSSRQQNPQGHRFALESIDFGAAQILLMPGESFVGYQLLAQSLRKDTLVLTPGYGECAPGYIPTRQAFEENFNDVWLWVDHRAPELLTAAMKKVLTHE